MLSPTSQHFIACDTPFAEADLVVFGAPFDGTTSFRPGTRFGPEAIRRDSYGLETYSPYQNLDLEDAKILDSGDLELPFGHTPMALQAIEDRCATILKNNKVPVMVGGEHLATLGCMRAIVQKYPDVHIIHFDAHTDLRDEYLDVSLSHASVLKKVWDLVGDYKIYQFGIRSGLKEEFIWAKEHLYQHLFDVDAVANYIPQLIDKPIYLTVDLDILDPSVFPGTGTPEPGGISFMELLNALLLLAPLNIVGFDVVELSPHYDQSGVSTAVACKILRELLLLCAKQKN